MRLPRGQAIAGITLGLLASAVLVTQSSNSAYQGTTSNDGDAWTAGTVALADDDAGVAAFSAANLKPGQTAARCIDVSYTGSLGAAVTLSTANVSGALAPYLDLVVTEGSGGGFGSCAGYVPESLAFTGTLAAFGTQSTNFATGVGSFAPPGASQRRTFRVQYTLNDTAPNSAQAATAAADLRWEARSMTNLTPNAFGRNTASQLGNGGTTNALAATSPGTSTTWVDLDGGQSHSCGVRAEGTLWCWGANNLYQLGDGTTTARTTPTQIGAVTTWATVSAGDTSTCATRRDGSLWCWGQNGSGQLGQSDFGTRTTPTRVQTATDWSSVSVGNTNVCGLRTGTLWCWGNNNTGQLGDASLNNRSAPTRIGSASDWSVVQTGGDSGAGSPRHTCGIREPGDLWCWGSNSVGQLGDGTGMLRQSPVRIGTASTWTSTSLGAASSCGTQTDGSLWCWGVNNFNQVGDGTTINRSAPVRIGAATGWSNVTNGFNHSCALRTDRSTWCWGASDDGRLGDGGVVAVSTPKQVATAVRGVGTGWDHTFFLRWPTS